MKRMFINSEIFTRIYDSLIKEDKLLQSDFEELEKELLREPAKGEVIPGLDGLRKIRLKSASKEKRGGFRVDYLDIPEKGIIYYVVIYPKNVQEDLSSEEKRIILRMIKKIKEGAKNE